MTKATAEISSASLRLLRELTIIPQVVGYDHRISELDNARLIQWVAGEGYFISDAGRAVIAAQIHSPDSLAQSA